MRASYAAKRAFIGYEFLEWCRKHAEFVGEAEFTDYIFRCDEKELWFVREIHKNVWPSMKIGKFYAFAKTNMRWKDSFQIFEMPIGDPLVECSSVQDAEKHMPNRLIFSFKRKTIEFRVNDIFIYVEDVEHIELSADIVCRNTDFSIQENMRKVNEFLAGHKHKAVASQVAMLVMHNI